MKGSEGGREWGREGGREGEGQEAGRLGGREAEGREGEQDGEHRYSSIPATACPFSLPHMLTHTHSPSQSSTLSFRSSISSWGGHELVVVGQPWCAPEWWVNWREERSPAGRLLPLNMEGGREGGTEGGREGGKERQELWDGSWNVTLILCEWIRHAVQMLPLLISHWLKVSTLAWLADRGGH